MDVKVGTAGWSIARTDAERFESEGTTLERYASRFSVVEINSSFHRPHRQSTWARWAEVVPSDFQFAVKLPKEISHRRKLANCNAVLETFLGEVAGLGDKLGVLLLQLPPKHEFHDDVAGAFLRRLADRSPAMVACEPRHPSWTDAKVDALLEELKIARVAADPAINSAAAQPGGWRGLHYWRLHGSPVIYRSNYDDRIADLASAMAVDRTPEHGRWCIFDNTASSAATGNALALQALVRSW